MSTAFEERLGRESSLWVEDGIIDVGQRERLLARHPAEVASGGRFVAILGAVGGVLLLAGVGLLISSNWEKIGDWVKIGGLAALLVAAYWGGWRAKISPGRYPRTGDALFMVGAGLFMAGIALVSQIYHLNSRPATGVMIWWLGIAAVPWLTRSTGAQAMSLLAGLTWLGMEMNTPGSLLEVVSYAGHIMPFFALFALIGMAVWLWGMALRGTMYGLFGGLHEKWGALITCVCLYMLGFARHKLGGWQSHDAGILWYPLLVAGGLLVIAAVFAWRRNRREVMGFAIWWVIALVPTVALAAGIWLGDGQWLWSVLAWVGLFVLNIAMIRTGLATQRAGWVNMGIGFIGLNIFTRYFDLFGTMLRSGVLFVVSGVIVLTLGIYLERKRRVLLAKMREGKEAVA